jgi:hypothetical protein
MRVRQRVHRSPASRVVTIAIRPLASRRDAHIILLIFKNVQAVYFYARGWTGTQEHAVICPSASARKPVVQQRRGKQTIVSHEFDDALRRNGILIDLALGRRRQNASMRS